jgi:hypothetical protein
MKTNLNHRKSASHPEEFKRLLGYYHAQKIARTMGHAQISGSKPDWSFAPKGLIKIEPAGRMEMNKSRH